MAEIDDQKMLDIESTAAAVVNLIMPLVTKYDGRSASLCLEKASKQIKAFCVNSGLPPA
jgi:hypothetical protein